MSIDKCDSSDFFIFFVNSKIKTTYVGHVMSLTSRITIIIVIVNVMITIKIFLQFLVLEKPGLDTSKASYPVPSNI